MKVIRAEEFVCGCKYWSFDDGSHFIMNKFSQPVESSYQEQSPEWHQQLEAIAAHTKD